MAIHTQLSIYKVAYDLLHAIAELTAQFPRNFRASMGERIRTECIDIMLLVARANKAKDKTPHLETLLERIDVIEFLIRLCKDMRFISIPQYAKCIELTSSIGKQANGWRKSQRV